MSRILTLTFAFAMTVSAAVRIEKTNYKGWPNCHRITNGDVELIVTGDVGPRVILYGFPCGQNLFKEYAEMIGKSGESQWMIRGGHRLWMAPEDPVLTYALDNGPVKIEVAGGVLTATAPVEPLTGLLKQIVIKLAPSGSGVEVVHRITNKNRWSVEFAAWALTVMAPGGAGITGFPPRGRHPEVLPPTNPLVMWAYTNLADKRWTFTEKYAVLRQDPKASEPEKIGHFNEGTWGAYLLGTDLFIKRYKADPSKTYPDFGCSYETFTNADMLELETLGPVTKVAPDATVEHVERWSLHKNVRIPAWTDAELDKVLLPRLGK